MNRRIKVLIYLIILLIVQIYLMDWFRCFSIKADLFIPALVNLGLNYYGLLVVWSWSIFFGSLEDLWGSYPVGINCLIFFLIGYLLYKLVNTFTIENLTLKVVMVALLTLLINILKCVFLYLYGIIPSLNACLQIVFSSTLFTSLLSIIVFKTMDLIYL